jgi:hypothetical protein
VVLGDVVVAALEAELLVLAAVEAEAEAGVEGVLPLAPVVPEFVLPAEAADDTVTVLIGARVLLASALPVEAALEFALPDAGLPESERLCAPPSNPTKVCSRLANSAARPLPMPALPLAPLLSVLWLVLLPLDAFEPELVLLVGAV